MCEWASKQTPDPKNSTPPPSFDIPGSASDNTNTQNNTVQQQEQQQQQNSVIRTKRKTIQYHTTLYRHKTKQYCTTAT